MRQGTPPPATNSLRTRWPGPLGATSSASTPAGGLMKPKWMLKPCEHMRMLPGFRFGSISFSVEVALQLVGDEDVDDVGLLGGVGGADRA